MTEVRTRVLQFSLNRLLVVTAVIAAGLIARRQALLGGMVGFIVACVAHEVIMYAS